MSEKPILVKAGDTRVLLNGVSPKVDCRVLSEDYYQSLERQLKEANKLLSRVHKGEYVSDIELYDEIEKQLKEKGDE